MEWWIAGACLFVVIIATVVVLAAWRQARETDREFFGD